jgi:hypothetical protein
MKTTATITVDEYKCDFCGARAWERYCCIVCAKHYCPDCQHKLAFILNPNKPAFYGLTPYGVEPPYAMRCKTCDDKLTELIESIDPLVGMWKQQAAEFLDRYNKRAREANREIERREKAREQAEVKP